VVDFAVKDLRFSVLAPWRSLIAQRVQTKTAWKLSYHLSRLVEEYDKKVFQAGNAANV